MTLPFPEPTDPLSSRAEVFLGYLDYFRSVAISKLQGLTDEELRSTRLPSGWVPLALLRHLAYVEYRWLVWGFEGRQVAHPWGDLHDGVAWTSPTTTRWPASCRPCRIRQRVPVPWSRRTTSPPSGSPASGGRVRRLPRWSASCSTSCRSTPDTSDTWTSSGS